MARLLASVAVLVSTALLGAYVYHSTSSSTFLTTRDAKEGATMPTLDERLPPQGWLLYTNERYGFSLFFPEYLSVKERDHGQNSMTITFENVERGEGFEIFVVPYIDAHVSEARFRQDVPSGVRENPVDVMVHNVPAVAFFSKHDIGETAEVWFVYRGHLYEVATLKEHSVWLGNILQSWQFTQY